MLAIFPLFQKVHYNKIFKPAVPRATEISLPHPVARAYPYVSESHGLEDPMLNDNFLINEREVPTPVVNYTAVEADPEDVDDDENVQGGTTLLKSRIMYTCIHTLVHINTIKPYSATTLILRSHYCNDHLISGWIFKIFPLFIVLQFDYETISKVRPKFWFQC